ALADEGVAGDLAAASDRRALLDFDEGADLGLVADLAAVEIDEARQLDVLPEFHVGSDAVVGVVHVGSVNGACVAGGRSQPAPLPEVTACGGGAESFVAGQTRR